MVDRLADNTEDLYKKEYFEKPEKTSSGYSTYLSMPAANMLGKYAFARLISENTGKHLDLGCANGSLIDIFSTYGYESRGLEISKDAVEICTIKGLNVEQSNLHKFPDTFKNQDIITAYDVLEHLDSPGVTLKNIFNALNDDGVFVFTTLAVTKYDSTDYWFNNSLEHYIYFDEASLNSLLTRVFGDGNYYFNKVSINGVSEFWGFAKKKPIGDENRIKKYIENEINPDNSKDAYLLSLYLNQLSRFDRSENIIKEWYANWTESEKISLTFYNLYSQGKFEKALNEIENKEQSLMSSTPLIWHSVYDAKRQMSEIEKFIIRKEGSEQIIKLRDELFTITNSRYYKIFSRFKSKYSRMKSFLNKIKKRMYLLKKIYKIIFRLIKSFKSILSTSLNVEKQYTTSKADKWTTKPLVSIIIPFYNRADTIDATLESLRVQTFTDFEVILVDDGSTDQSSKNKILSLKKDKLIDKVIIKDNQGVAAARNTGIEEAIGKYIVCLDSDDLIEPTYIEKCALVLETHPDISIISTYMTIFGVDKTNFFRQSPNSSIMLIINSNITYSIDYLEGEKIYKHSKYSPKNLYRDNMIITASMFRREAWVASGGYKSNIGYEDWEFWVNLHELGYRAFQIQEPLFRYRVAINSRYIEDKSLHDLNVKKIHNLHRNYLKTIKDQDKKYKLKENLIIPEGSMINLSSSSFYPASDMITKKRILITMPWMTFGGAETLIRNFSGPIIDEYEIGFITGIKSDNEWEYKFREITSEIYHLPNLFQEDGQSLEFILNYIKTRKVEILHVIHNQFTIEYLQTIRKKFPDLKIIITMFNDSVDYFDKAIESSGIIQAFTADNQSVIDSFKSSDKYYTGINTIVIPNGVDTENTFNKSKQDRVGMRKKLGLKDSDVAVFYIGRISEEKNPQVFLDVAMHARDNSKYKFFMLGDGTIRRELFKKYSSVLDQDNFEYLGYQSNIPAYLSAADIFTLPSRVEGFPLSVLEAMSMEVIPICSKVGALPQIITHGKDGFLVNPGNSTEILEIIDSIVSEKKINQLKDNARNTVYRKYTIDKLGQNYKKLYRSLNG